MANQVAARLKGDDYQHLYAWWWLLALLIPREMVAEVVVEDDTASSVDDVTVRHEKGSGKSDLFHQIKYHVDHRDVYSTDALLERKPNHASLLQKFFRSWQALIANAPGTNPEIRLISNWTWDAADKVRDCISGEDNSLTDDFLTKSAGSNVGKLRARWKVETGAGDDEFEEFIHSLRFRLGFDCAEELERSVQERMSWIGLKHDIAALKVGVGIVRGWVKGGTQSVTKSTLEEQLKANDLYAPAETERAVAVYMHTIKKQNFDISPDHLLDWTELFEGKPNKKGHHPKDSTHWNDTMLPELERLETLINESTACRLIQARGLSRLSAWFAFGHAFSEVARYTIEVAQGEALWRTSDEPSSDFNLEAVNGEEGEVLAGDPKVVAIGISVTGSLDEDVRAYLTTTDEASRLLLLRPNRDLGFECLRGGSDAAALAREFKRRAVAFVKAAGASRLMLFYYGPLSGACFIGHRLNAICREVQIMEDQQPGYGASFLLE